jgi:hypothetical protein
LDRQINGRPDQTGTRRVRGMTNRVAIRRMRKGRFYLDGFGGDLGIWLAPLGRADGYACEGATVRYSRRPVRNRHYSPPGVAARLRHRSCTDRRRCPTTAPWMPAHSIVDTRLTVARIHAQPCIYGTVEARPRPQRLARENRSRAPTPRTRASRPHLRPVDRDDCALNLS